MAELRAPEVARDHATLDKQLKKIDKKYYTDDLLGTLTLNDKQHAVTIATVPDEPEGDEGYFEHDTSGYVINPIEVDGEDGERVAQPFVEPIVEGTPGPVATEEEIAEREDKPESPVLPEVTAEDEQAAAAEADEASEVEGDSESSEEVTHTDEVISEVEVSEEVSEEVSDET